MKFIAIQSFAVAVLSAVGLTCIPFSASAQNGDPTIMETQEFIARMMRTSGKQVVYRYSADDKCLGLMDFKPVKWPEWGTRNDNGWIYEVRSYRESIGFDYGRLAIAEIKEYRTDEVSIRGLIISKYRNQQRLVDYKSDIPLSATPPFYKIRERAGQEELSSTSFFVGVNAERVANAINHLIQKCGGQDDLPF